MNKFESSSFILSFNIRYVHFMIYLFKSFPFQTHISSPICLRDFIYSWFIMQTNLGSFQSNHSFLHLSVNFQESIFHLPNPSVVVFFDNKLPHISGNLFLEHFLFNPLILLKLNISVSSNLPFHVCIKQFLLHVCPTHLSKIPPLLIIILKYFFII